MSYSRGKRLTKKPRAGNKWNRYEIETIVFDMKVNGLSRVAAAAKHNISYNLLCEKITLLNAGELK
jgi:hypothetical protein